MIRNFIFLLFISFAIVSCKDNTSEPQPVVNLKNGVFILNQGNFTAGNASLSYYESAENILYNDIFYTINKVPLGDVAQSITLFNGIAYIVVNNSGLVYAIDARTAEFQSKITGLVSPRYLLPVGGDKAYISDLYEKNMYIVNLHTSEIAGLIDVGRSTEEMIMAGNEVFAANWSGYLQSVRNDKLLIINTTTDLMVDSIQVGLEPNSMAIDREGNLWVLCSGGYLDEEFPTLWKIEPGSRSVLVTFTFPLINGNPDNLEINRSGDSLFFLNDGVYRMSIHDASLPETPFILEESGRNFLYLGIDPNSGMIYVSDALDYSKNGYVYIFNASGDFQQEMETGIIPGPFGFNY